MGKSINPMGDFLKPKPQGETMTGSALRPIVLMSLQPAIPWRVALLHCPPPLHRLDTILHRPADFVNHHLAGAGEFSTGIMGNFQPDLTITVKPPLTFKQIAHPSVRIHTRYSGLLSGPRRGRDRFLRTGVRRFGGSPRGNGTLRRNGTRLVSTVHLE